MISLPIFSVISISRSLVPVTQLYVSVDASTKDSLKKIDRPLFKDFWPRFLDSLRALGEKVSCPLRSDRSDGESSLCTKV